MGRKGCASAPDYNWPGNQKHMRVFPAFSRYGLRSLARLWVPCLNTVTKGGVLGIRVWGFVFMAFRV